MTLHCFSCGASQTLAAGERIGFRDVCAGCRNDLHVCRNCAHHDPSAHNQCREPGTEWVAERERANRCEWFRPREGRSGAAGGAGERERAKGALDALFKKG